MILYAHTASLRAVIALLSLLALLGSAACEVQVVEEEADIDAPDETGAIPLIITEGPGASTLAFVPVTIHGEGPFQFALDTGASSSVIDEQLAEELGLEQVGDPEPGVGVGGVAEAVPMGAESWAIGDLELDEGVLLAIDLPGPDRDAGMNGLLGSDILSAFGVVVIDYDEELLYLGTLPNGE